MGGTERADVLSWAEPDCNVTTCSVKLQDWYTQLVWLGFLDKQEHVFMLCTRFDHNDKWMTLSGAAHTFFQTNLSPRLSIRLIWYSLIEDEARDSHLVSLCCSFPFVKWIWYYFRGDARTSELQFAKVFITGTDGNRMGITDPAVTLTRTAFPATAHPVLCA